VYQPRKSLGYHGAKLLYQQMKNPQDRSIEQVLPVKLVVRESSVPAGEPVVTTEAKGSNVGI
jgi:DNA-binding LacI/PurR family transcriptional regulator